MAIKNKRLKTKNKKHKLKIKKSRVVVAMSGGVDSSVSAALLKKQGYNVIGIFLKFWQPPKVATRIGTDIDTDRHGSFENVCCSQEALCQARRVADILKIPFYVLDASREFKKQVVHYYILEYESGRTPNPCVRCNQLIKFGWLLKKAQELGAEYLATGHYARTRTYTEKDTNLRGYKLLTAVDKEKDQTYFLWTLKQEQLRHLLFPIGEYKKSQVRQMAKKFGLPVFAKKDSQGICFIPNRDNPAFLARYTKKLNQPDEIVDLKGNVLGHHKGLAYYTIGQRHGLEGVQLKMSNVKCQMSKGKGGFPPAYVVKLDIEKNRLVVGEEKDLYSRELVAEKVNWIANAKAPLDIARGKQKIRQGAKIECQAKIRYGHPAESATVEQGDNETVRVVFKRPQRAITPGQSIVFYLSRAKSRDQGEEVLGGGTIR